MKTIPKQRWIQDQEGDFILLNSPVHARILWTPREMCNFSASVYLGTIEKCEIRSKGFHFLLDAKRWVEEQLRPQKEPSLFDRLKGIFKGVKH